jgi:hypothetical protein
MRTADSILTQKAAANLDESIGGIGDKETVDGVPFCPG